jgi:DNA-binding response OmpR family regulator
MGLTIALHEPTRELIKGHIRIRLQEQPFQIMRLLLARPGALVTCDQLRSRLWMARSSISSTASTLQ